MNCFKHFAVFSSKRYVVVVVVFQEKHKMSLPILRSIQNIHIGLEKRLKIKGLYEL